MLDVTLPLARTTTPPTRSGVSSDGYRDRAARSGVRGTLSRMTSDAIETPDGDPKRDYREAYEQWQKHLAGVHDLLLEGKRLPPDQIKGLLNREARAKERYDAARLRLLGIDG